MGTAMFEKEVIQLSGVPRTGLWFSDLCKILIILLLLAAILGHQEDL